jgi:hypothetical protein
MNDQSSNTLTDTKGRKTFHVSCRRIRDVLIPVAIRGTRFRVDVGEVGCPSHPGVKVLGIVINTNQIQWRVAV